MLKTSSRATVTISGLQKTITVAVQQSSFDCQSFIGVYIEHYLNHQSGANWSLKGVKYGRAPRARCDAALDEIVRNLQDRYVIEPGRLIPNRRPVVETFGEDQHVVKHASPLCGCLEEDLAASLARGDRSR